MLCLFGFLNLLHQGGKICSKYLTVQQKWDMTNYWIQCRVTRRACGTKIAYLFSRYSTSADTGLLYYSDNTPTIITFTLFSSEGRVLLNLYQLY
jgi:hypothetical protein